MHTAPNLSDRASTPTDDDLIQAYRKGDARAFEQLLRRYEKPLFTFIVRMVSNRDDAEDVFQETLARVVQNIRSYDEQGKFSKWLLGIAYRLCVDRSRRKERWKFVSVVSKDVEVSSLEENLADPAPLPDALLEQKELKEMMEQALHHLSPQQREVFLLRQHSDVTFREIAEMVERPLNTVLGQMHLAVLSIRTFLQEKMK